MGSPAWVITVALGQVVAIELNPLNTIAMINVKRTKNDKVNLFMFFDFNCLNVELIIT